MLIAFKFLAAFVLLVIFGFILVFVYGIFQCLKDSWEEESENYEEEDNTEDYD